MDISSLELVAGTVAPATPQAYSRLETISDFHDLVFLAASGYDIAFVVVPGSLSGFGRPMDITIIRRVSAMMPNETPQRAKGKVWHIVVADTPQSLAQACRSLLTEKSSISGITLDLTVVGQGDRAVALEKMFGGITRCLNQRAGRLLDAADIADLMGWFATIVTTKVDAQVRYGSYPHWGAVMRRQQVDPSRAWTHPPAAANAMRTLLCAVKPAEDDLRMVAATGHVFGVVNIASLRRRAPWAASTSADRSLSLGNASAVPVVSYTPSANMIDEASRPIPPAPPGRNVHANVEARYAATWTDLRAISTALYAETMTTLPSILQPAWDHQREALHPYAILVSPVVGDIADLARHSLDAGIKAARSHAQPMPVAVISAVAPDLDAAVANARGLIGHAGGVFVDNLDFIGRWDDLVAVTVRL